MDRELQKARRDADNPQRLFTMLLRSHKFDEASEMIQHHSLYCEIIIQYSYQYKVFGKPGKLYRSIPDIVEDLSVINLNPAPLLNPHAGDFRYRLSKIAAVALLGRIIPIADPRLPRLPITDEEFSAITDGISNHPKYKKRHAINKGLDSRLQPKVKTFRINFMTESVQRECNPSINLRDAMHQCAAYLGYDGREPLVWRNLTGTVVLNDIVPEAGETYSASFVPGGGFGHRICNRPCCLE